MDKITILLSVKEYDKIRKGEEVEIVVTAKNREPMIIFASNSWKIEEDYSIGKTPYSMENAINTGHIMTKKL